MQQVDCTSGLATGQMLMTNIYGHDNCHLGEVEYLSGLLGLQGSVTL